MALHFVAPLLHRPSMQIIDGGSVGSMHEANAAGRSEPMFTVSAFADFLTPSLSCSCRAEGHVLCSLTLVASHDAAGPGQLYQPRHAGTEISLARRCGAHRWCYLYMPRQQYAGADS